MFRHQADQTLEYLVVGWKFCVGSVTTETADGDVDEARIESRHDLVPESKSIHHAGTEVFDHDIDLGQQVENHVASEFVLEVDHNASLVAIELRKKARKSRLAKWRPTVATWIAGGRFHFDHVCPEIAEGLGAHGTRNHCCEVEHAKA